MMFQFLLASVAAASHAGTMPVQEIGKFTASDSAAGDSLGWSVGVDNGVLIAGAYLEDDNGFSNDGAAYLFSSGPNEYDKLRSDDLAPSDWFGYSVAVDGGLAIIGSRFDNNIAPDAGSAYIYDTATGAQLRKLIASDAGQGDSAGFAVAISGNLAVIGAPYESELGERAGAAYIFDVTTGAQLHKLLPSDGAADDNFGSAVDIDGTMVIVGSPENAELGEEAGAAYVFDATTGQQITKLLAERGARFDLFGHSVAIDGNTAGVGAIYDDDRGNNSGSAYLFNATTGAQLHQINGSDEDNDDQFGYSIAMDNGMTVVGAVLRSAGSDVGGGAYLFDTASGQELTIIEPSDLSLNDGFGRSVAIQDNIIAVGASGKFTAGPSSGAAYLFRITQPCAADVNGDGEASPADFTAWLGCFNDPNSAPYCDNADVNNSGSIEPADFTAWLAAFNAGCG